MLKRNTNTTRFQRQRFSLLSLSLKSLSLFFSVVRALASARKKVLTLMSLQTGRTTKKFGVRLTY